MASGWLNWYLDRRKHRQEVKNLEAQAKTIEAETRQKYMDLAKMYVDEYTKNTVAVAGSSTEITPDGIIRPRGVILKWVFFILLAVIALLIIKK